MYLAMEYMQSGDLEHTLKEIENSPTHLGPLLPEEDAQEVSRQILEGLKIMHDEDFAHRDLKPQNIFVVQKQPWWVKIGDFGLSKKRTEDTDLYTIAGTQLYMAPEFFHYVPSPEAEISKYTTAVDLWALGCIIHRIISGSVPFQSLLALRNYCLDPSNAPLRIPSTMESARNLVQDLLLPHPARRPTAGDALNSIWLGTSSPPSCWAKFGVLTNF